MYRTKLLVVANQTVDSDELFETLRERAEKGPVSITLIVPQDQQHGMAHRLVASLERLHDAGIEAEGMLGDVDPCVAVIEAWDPRRYDEVLVSTLPSGTSRWLQIDLPHRIARAIDAPVHHIESRPARDRITA
jgi:hypothetical protein